MIIVKAGGGKLFSIMNQYYLQFINCYLFDCSSHRTFPDFLLIIMGGKDTKLFSVLERMCCSRSPSAVKYCQRFQL